MPKVLALRNTRAKGQLLEAGKTYDISEEDARILIPMKKAELVKGEKVDLKDTAEENLISKEQQENKKGGKKK